MFHRRFNSSSYLKIYTTQNGGDCIAKAWHPRLSRQQKGIVATRLDLTLLILSFKFEHRRLDFEANHNFKRKTTYKTSVRRLIREQCRRALVTYYNVALLIFDLKDNFIYITIRKLIRMKATKIVLIFHTCIDLFLTTLMFTLDLVLEHSQLYVSSFGELSIVLLIQSEEGKEWMIGLHRLHEITRVELAPRPNGLPTCTLKMQHIAI